MTQGTCDLCEHRFVQVSRTGRPRTTCYECRPPKRWSDADRLAARSANDRSCPLLPRPRAVRLDQGVCVHCKRSKWRKGPGRSLYCGACKFAGAPRPCAACGVVYRRPKTRMAGNADSYCVPCRRAHVTAHKRGIRPSRIADYCLWCFSPLPGRKQRWCSEACNAAQKTQWRQFHTGDRCHIPLCIGCGTMMPFRVNQMFCDGCVAANRTHSEARRRRVLQAGDRTINWKTVGARDGFTCHLCGSKARASAGSAKNRQGAVVDHIVPISDGGTHEWSNVACAHWGCNTSRGNRGIAQLRLVG